ncbi:MAG TPA: glycosyltransferase, partial [Methyloceanibacter sp.]|nr:glycosyltransferase [Methyloceanibacter sp.]
AYASADAFVFPSVTDTFGLVLLEALAAGLPVAAYPATGPLDVLTDPRAAILSTDLRTAALKALDLDRAAARAHALRFSWEHSARQFFENVLAAHHLGLPARLKRLKRWRKKDKAPRNRETARLGGTGPFYSHASVWGTLWGNSRPPRDGSQPGAFQEDGKEFLGNPVTS